MTEFNAFLRIRRNTAFVIMSPAVMPIHIWIVPILLENDVNTAFNKGDHTVLPCKLGALTVCVI